MAFVNLKPNVQGIVHSKASLVVHMEAMDQLKGLWVGKHIVPSGGGMCAIRPTSKVVLWATPSVCLAANIQKGVAMQGLLQAIKGAGITIEVPNHQHRTLRLHAHVTYDCL